MTMARLSGWNGSTAGTAVQRRRSVRGASQKTDKQYADDMAEFMGSRPEDQCPIIVDPSAASFIQELRSRGVGGKAGG